jgi:nucleotide-binding universal stress UspA family protein
VPGSHPAFSPSFHLQGRKNLPAHSGTTFAIRNGDAELTHKPRKEQAMIRSILVPLDGSPFGEQAVPLALEIARRAQAAVQLIHVHQLIASPWSGSELAMDVELETDLRRQEQDYLEKTAQRLKGEVPVTTALLEGPVAEVIHERALGCGADLIVMSTHGRGPLSRFWLGSVADQLIRRTAAPLLLVRPHEGEAAPVAVHHVLVPLDGSEQAEQVLGPSLDLAALLAADVELLRVVEPVIVPDRRWAGNATSGVDPELVHRLAADARGYLERVVISLDGMESRVTPQVVVNRRAADAILAEAGARPGTLVALATHARAGLARLVMGSVADKVIRGTTGPVLVYRPLAS